MWSRRLALGWTCLILLLTLLPGAGNGGSPADLPPVFCLVCGGRGGADAIVNVLLFLPLGFALATALGSPFRVVALVLALSLAIEVLQEMIPGRYPAAGDVVYNAMGGVSGVGLAALRARLSSPSRRVAGGLTLGSGAAAGALFVLTGILLAPSLPAGTYRGHLAELGYMEAYEGQVIEASLGSVPLASGVILDREPVVDFVRSGAPLEARVVVGPTTGALATIVSVLDESSSEVLLLGADGADLVLRLRYRADDLRMDRPDLRARRAFAATRIGDTISVRVRETPEGYSLRVDQREYAPLRHTPGEGWALLLHPGQSPQWVDHALNIAWAAGLLVLAGWWAPGPGWAAGALSIALAGMVTAAVAGPLVELAQVEVLAAVGGVGLGLVLGRLDRGGRTEPGEYASVEHTNTEEEALF